MNDEHDAHGTAPDADANARDGSASAVRAPIGEREADMLRRGREFDPATRPSDAEFVGSILRPLAAMIEPDAADDRLEAASRRRMRATSHAGRDVVLTTRELYGRVMASAHPYSIDGDMMSIELDTVAFLLKEPGDDRCYEWGGPAHLLVALARHVDGPHDQEGDDA